MTMENFEVSNCKVIKYVESHKNNREDKSDLEITKLHHYVLGFISSDFDKIKTFQNMKMIKNPIFCDAVMSSIVGIGDKIEWRFQADCKVLEVAATQADIRTDSAVVIDKAMDGYVYHTSDKTLCTEAKLTGKWISLKFSSTSTLIGISGLMDLYSIDLTNTPPVLQIEHIPGNLKIEQVACGSDHVLILTKSPGRVFSKGLGSRGQLGQGDLENSPEFKEVSSLGCVVHQIDCGSWHSVCLTDAGDVYGWGWNEAGQLGVPSFSSKDDLISVFEDEWEEDLMANHGLSVISAPVLVCFPPSPSHDEWDIQKVCCGSRHTACLDRNGYVLCWGWAGMGQLGELQNSTLSQSRDWPVLVEGFGPIITDISCTRWATVITVPVAL